MSDESIVVLSPAFAGFKNPYMNHLVHRTTYCCIAAKQALHTAGLSYLEFMTSALSTTQNGLIFYKSHAFWKFRSAIALFAIVDALFARFLPRTHPAPAEFLNSY
jgi:hypothetical protein